MPGGVCGELGELPETCLRVLSEARRGVLSTLAADDSSRVLPVCFAVVEAEIVIAVDDKPKSTRRLARLSDIERAPRATFLADRWDEDWTRLAWVMVRGEARIEEADFGAEALAGRYPQYGGSAPGGPAIVITPRRVNWWSWT